MEKDNKTINICRVCLESDVQKALSLFEKLKDSFIFDHINSIAHIDIKVNDGYPDKICSVCLLNLETVVQFIDTCRYSNSVLLGTTSLDTITPRDIKKEEPSEFDCFDDDNDITVDSLDEGLPETTHTGKKLKKIIECHDCGEVFKSKCKLRVHWKSVHLPLTLSCPTCNKKFTTHKILNTHTKSCLSGKSVWIEGKGKDKVYHCKSCPFKTIHNKAIHVHVLRHTGERPHKCELCGSAFTQQSTLVAHKEDVHKMYKFETTCQFCGKHIKGRKNMYIHIYRHNNKEKKRFECEICKKTYKSKQSLQQHMHRHTGIKTYTCEKCGTAFFTHSELSNHIRVKHKNIKPCYKCDLCEYSAHARSLVVNHKSKHSSTNIPCTVCGMFFDDEDSLALHQRRHFERNYPCMHCELKFYTKKSLGTHVKAKHNCTMVLDEKTNFKVKLERSVRNAQRDNLEMALTSSSSVYN